MAKRRALSKRLRFEVFKRDGFKCQYCGREAPSVVLEADHIDPVAAGGSNDIANLVTSCGDCNRGKGARKLADASVAAKSRAQLAELQERREQIDMLLEWRSGLRDLEGEIVTKVAATWASLGTGWVLNATGMAGLKKILRAYSVPEVVSAMETAVEQYCSKGIDEHSVSHAWNSIAGICRVGREEAADPGIKDLYYARGIFRKRMRDLCNYYGDDWRAMGLLKDARAAGVATHDLRSIASQARNWTDFELMLRAAAKECA